MTVSAGSSAFEPIVSGVRCHSEKAKSVASAVIAAEKSAVKGEAAYQSTWRVGLLSADFVDKVGNSSVRFFVKPTEHLAG